MGGGEEKPFTLSCYSNREVKIRRCSPSPNPGQASKFSPSQSVASTPNPYPYLPMLPCLSLLSCLRECLSTYQRLGVGVGVG